MRHHRDRHTLKIHRVPHVCRATCRRTGGKVPWIAGSLIRGGNPQASVDSVYDSGPKRIRRPVTLSGRLVQSAVLALPSKGITHAHLRRSELLIGTRYACDPLDDYAPSLHQEVFPSASNGTSLSWRR